MSCEVPINLYFLVLPDSVLLDVTGPAEVFQYAQRLGFANFNLKFVGPVEQVKNSIGLDVRVAPLPDYVEPNSWLLCTGTVGKTVDLNSLPITQVRRWFKGQSGKFAKYISICSGAVVFSSLGVLSHRACTTHHAHLEELRETDATSKVLDNRLFVVDGDVYSSAGILAGVDLALYLVQQTCGANCASQVARHMVLFSRRGPNDPSASPWLENRNHIHSSVHHVQDKIQANPSKMWTLEELSESVGCSPRHLTRIFKDNTGITTREYVHNLRISLAMQLLQTTRWTIDDIAEHCGFDDPRQFRRLWARRYGQPPSAYRV
ncbi:GlxA family transcriptional regulator [Marinomonas balearica]|uniref:AraC family transcriptional regulator with amidase-like domain n=1 Tax=Marinomonas balearica TaxID=491947 RepID=A0A4R6ME88_9GAMM|nr:helix-turn-helix domain-containing protein [Marinomonas balearica]TDO99943.1 AraC family transcriptional regulator with amidase-like domain [Marinomonas balearica]